MAKCPYCGFAGGFRLLKTWKFKWYNVHYHECPRCDRKFRFYTGVSPRGKKSEFIIRVGAPRRVGGAGG